MSDPLHMLKACHLQHRRIFAMPLRRRSADARPAQRICLNLEARQQLEIPPGRGTIWAAGGGGRTQS